MTTLFSKKNLFSLIALFAIVLSAFANAQSAHAASNPGDNATVVVSVNADGTIKIVSDTPELYVQGDEISNQTFTGVSLGGGQYVYTLPATKLSFEVKNAKSISFGDSACRMSAGTTWVICDGVTAVATQTGGNTGVPGGGFLDSQPGETVLQTGEGDIVGPAAGTMILPELTGTFGSRIEEINAAIAAGCPFESGICYRNLQGNTDVVYTGSTDMVNHMKQEKNVLEFLRTRGTIVFKTTSETYLEAVNFTVTDLVSGDSKAYSVATRLHLNPGYYAFNNASNAYNPGCRVANVNQLSWLNSEANAHFVPAAYLDFATGKEMNREGKFVDGSVTVSTLTVEAAPVRDLPLVPVADGTARILSYDGEYLNVLVSKEGTYSLVANYGWDGESEKIEATTDGDKKLSFKLPADTWSVSLEGAMLTESDSKGWNADTSNAGWFLATGEKDDPSSNDRPTEKKPINWLAVILGVALLGVLFYAFRKPATATNTVVPPANTIVPPANTIVPPANTIVPPAVKKSVKITATLLTKNVPVINTLQADRLAQEYGTSEELKSASVKDIRRVGHMNESKAKEVRKFVQTL